jgi:hypothetical protein
MIYAMYTSVPRQGTGPLATVRQGARGAHVTLPKTHRHMPLVSRGSEGEGIGGVRHGMESGYCD